MTAREGNEKSRGKKWLPMGQGSQMWNPSLLRGSMQALIGNHAEGYCTKYKYFTIATETTKRRKKGINKEKVNRKTSEEEEEKEDE